MATALVAVNENRMPHALPPARQSPSALALLVLRPDLRLVHSTREGWNIVRELRQQSDQLLLPSVIMQMAGEILGRIQATKATEEWEHCVVHNAVDTATDSFTLCGFAVREKGSSTPSYIVIHINRRAAHTAVFTERTEQYQLSQREICIVQYLAKGMTNKEIGQTCGIEEPTVKAHIKHIMEKTGATTRTAILSRLYGL